MIKVSLFLSSCFSKLSSCAFACFAYFICSSRECLWLMFFSQAQKEFTPSGCGGFFGGYRFIKTVSCFVACNHPIQMTEDILCSSPVFIVVSLFLITRFIGLVLQVNCIFKATGQAENKSCRHTCSLWERIHCLVCWIIFFEQIKMASQET